MIRRAASLGLVAIAVAVALAAAPPARAQDKKAKKPVSCVAHVPAGATAPTLTERLPASGMSGYVVELSVDIAHGKGETVLPDAFRPQPKSEAAEALGDAGFTVPDPDGGAAPSVRTEAGPTGATTHLSIPIVPLAPAPGKVSLVLPPLPVALARANGEIVTVCTAPHELVVEDPIGKLENPKVAPSPDPRPQREEWLAAKIGAVVALVVLALAAVGVWLFRRWRKQPRVAPAAPPKLPWVAAMDELAALRASPLLAEGKFDELFDRVSDCVRKYLGARYGFDGLETTTDEMRALLRRVRPNVPELGRIASFLADCDLVKFARRVPTRDECVELLDRGQAIVRFTTPPVARTDAGREAA